MNPRYCIAVIGRGEAREADRELLGPEVRSIVRYADPIVWITATAIARALAEKPLKDGAIGLIVVSDDGPLEAMNSIADAAAEGYSSPLRYPASNPGSIVGVSAIALGLRGPTMNLTMTPQAGIPVALIAASGWLIDGHCDRVAVAGVFCRAEGDCLARCAVFSRQENAALPSEIENWLIDIQ